MEKRVILAFVLSFVVLYAFSALYMRRPVSEGPVRSEQAPSASTANAGVVKTETPAADSQRAFVPPTEVIRSEKAEELPFDAPLYTATFSNVGGVLKSFRLKQYSDGSGRPLELINQEAGNKQGWPLVLATADKAIDEQLREARFAGRRGPNGLVLEFASDGLYVKKELRFDAENYVFALETRLTKDGKEIPHAVVWQGSFGDQSIPQDPAKRHAVYQSDAAYKRIALQSLKDPQNVTSMRAGVEDQYFAAMFLSAADAVAVKISKEEYAGPDGKPTPILVLSTAAAEGKGLRLYVGPKQQEWLAKADPQLSAVQDYGFWEFIAKPLVFCLLWIHSYIGNFGWSIILLTIGVNLILFPLRLKQQVSMLKMQKIQPHMRRLQDQYKKMKANDPRRTEIQAEMMGLYKEHGVNPMGGCLPLLLQMPLLLGFYSALAYSIELRRAPWILWIKDLSQPDPYYVIPILMAVTMILQQKLTPTANVDPAQARMMMLMPLVMTFMFLLVSSGLALYWFTGSLVGVGQQIFINRYWSPRAEASLKARSTREA